MIRKDGLLDRLTAGAVGRYIENSVRDPLFLFVEAELVTGPTHAFHRLVFRYHGEAVWFNWRPVGFGTRVYEELSLAWKAFEPEFLVRRIALQLTGEHRIRSGHLTSFPDRIERGGECVCGVRWEFTEYRDLLPTPQ